MTSTQMIDITKLRRRHDARTVDRNAVAALAESIAEVGILSPLVVRAKRMVVNGFAADGFEIIAGVHRYEASSLAGLSEVPCIVVEHDDLRAELAMIDENLCRAELSAAARAAATARRKAIYEALHPETKHGAIGNGREKSRQVGDSTDERFTSSTATATGKSERAVQRDAERGLGVAAGVLKLIAGTRLDTGAYLDKLKALAIDDQMARARRDLEAPPRPMLKPVKPVRVIDHRDGRTNEQFQLSIRFHGEIVEAAKSLSQLDIAAGLKVLDACDIEELRKAAVSIAAFADALATALPDAKPWRAPDALACSPALAS